MIRAGVITGYGINADRELQEAFALAGARAETVHIGTLIRHPTLLKQFHIIGFPGGFSFGDHLGAGLVCANICKKYIGEALTEFIHNGNLIIGICNGFQVLVKMGLLPNLDGTMTQEVSLIHNDSGIFEDSWVDLSFPESVCVWTVDIPDMSLPIRHGEGRFITRSQSITEQLVKERRIALTYTRRNPNGSVRNIAGITDSTGRVLGLMPHPEAYLTHYNHPQWQHNHVEDTSGLLIFQRGVHYAQSNIL